MDMGARYCRDCHHRVLPIKHRPGNVITEVFLWLIFFPLGMVYSTWRLLSIWEECPRCASMNVRPMTPTLQRELLQRKAREAIDDFENGEKERDP